MGVFKQVLGESFKSPTRFAVAEASAFFTPRVFTTTPLTLPFYPYKKSPTTRN
jgi:hypothetical protein